MANSKKDILIKAIHDHLVSNGFSSVVSQISASQAYRHYEKSICNSKDVFKDTCDHAGSLAHNAQPDVNYKSPKAKVKPRKNKPQEMFNF